MTSSPRRTRDPTRRSRFLVGECALRQEDCNFSSKGRALRREDCILSSKDAHSDKKMASSRRRMRAPKRRLRFLVGGDRKSTRLNSSHSQISYAVFCLKKKKKENIIV